MSSSRSMTFRARADVAFNALHTAIARNGMTLHLVDPARGLVQFSSGMGVASWGENLSGLVQQVGPEVVTVQITSGLKFGLVDWGKNGRNLDKLFDELSAALPPAPDQQPVHGAWHPDPAGRHQLRWWDGSRWTEHVSDNGVTGSDPLPDPNPR